jgi:DNA-binding LytR/AlgR family response regulator
MSRTRTIQAIIVDDEPMARDELAFMLAQCGDVVVTGEAGDATEALSLIDADAPDIAFVDLRMPGPDGIALAEAIRSRSPSTQVVVVSAHDDGAVRAFEARVLDYLLKPVRLDRLKATLTRAREALPIRDDGADDAQLDRLAVRRKGAYVVVDLASVVYFEVEDELSWAVTDDDRYALDLPLTALAKRLSPTEFFRSHRAVLVRIDKIRSIEPTGAGTYELVLDHPKSPRVPLARERVRSLRERIPFAG